MTPAESALNRIIEIDRERMNQRDCVPSRLLPGGVIGHPALYQFVVIGFTREPLIRQVGYCVQVRKKCGQFISDLVFLRHQNGELVTHENQSFYAVNEEQERLARKVFEELPEDEDPALGYRCCDKVHEVGFLIEDSKSVPARIKPVMISVVGADKTELIAIL